jgi:hypothetical protein
MYARTTTTRIPPETINATAAFLIERAVPRYQTAAGFVMFLDLIDRETGQAIASTFWQTEADRLAAADLAARIRAETGAMARGDPPVVEQFEVFAREQSVEPFGPGPAFARVLRADVAPDCFDRTIDYIRHTVIPPNSVRPGFREFWLLADRASGHLMTFSLYDTVSNLKAADTTARALAAQALQDIALSNMQIKYYEVAIRA